MADKLKTVANASSVLRRHGYIRRARRFRRGVGQIHSDVWKKTNGRCTYCACHLNPFDRNAEDGFHVDHVTPRSAGGTDDITNLVPSCRRCNLAKAARTPEQWGGATTIAQEVH